MLFPIPKIRAIPVWLAEHTVDWFTKGRVTAIAYVAILFYLLPFSIIWGTRNWEIATFYDPVIPQ